MTNAIREALARGEIAAARRLWSQYIHSLVSQAREGCLSEAAFQEAGDLAEWCRRTLLCAQAHAQDHLRTIERADAYATEAWLSGPRLIQIKM